MHVVCVTFKIREGGMPDFLQMMKGQATTSLAKEPDCHRFDICLGGDGQSVFLYELYTDAEAFEFHLGSAHYRDFDQETAALVTQKEVSTFSLLS